MTGTELIAGEAGRAPAPAQGPNAALAAILGRLVETLDAETAALRSDPGFDLKESNARKSRQLYEFNKLSRGIDPGQLHPEDRAGIVRLRDKLVVNERVIKAHLGAVAEVAALVQNAIERHEADGTYSSAQFGRADAP